MRSAVAAFALSLAACVEHLPGIEGTQSLAVELVSPADPGSVDNRLPDAARDVTIKITAHGPDGLAVVDTTFGNTVDVYVQFLGSLTPDLGQMPLVRIPMTAGESAPAPLTLPPVFGPTVLWVEDGTGEAPTFATGTSPALWYRDAFVEDIQTPVDPMALDALESSPLEAKQVSVTDSAAGADGRLVVTSTYAQGYTLSDVACGAGGAPPCTLRDYGHMLVFSFSRARDEHGCDVLEGQVIDGFGGGVQEFNGLTEIGFPQTFVAGTADDCNARVVDPALIPPARSACGPMSMAPCTTNWLSDTIEFEKMEGGLISIDTATLGTGLPVMCPLDQEYETYKQWKLDIGAGCDDPINVITAGAVTSFDPALYVGQVIPRVVGTLRPVNIGSFNVWIIFPRSAADLTLP